MSPNEAEKIDPRVKRTRQMIEDAFNTLVSEKGFQNLSVQDLTERAGINRATFYAHFPDKYALLDHNIEVAFRKEVDNRMLNACQFKLQNLRTLVIVVCEFVDSSHNHCVMSEQQYKSLVEAQVRSQIFGLISHWVETIPNLIDKPDTRRHATIAASWALYGFAEEWSRNKRMPPLDEYADQVLPILAANLGLMAENAEFGL
jgi:AcrR family transcriptional regulator